MSASHFNWSYLLQMSSYKSHDKLMILFGQFIMILFGFHKIDPKVFLMKNWGCQKEEDFKLLKNYHLKPLDSGTVSNYYTASNNVWALRCHKRFDLPNTPNTIAYFSGSPFLPVWPDFFSNGFFSYRIVDLKKKSI